MLRHREPSSTHSGLPRLAHHERIAGEILRGPRYALRFEPALGLDEGRIHVLVQGVGEAHGEAIFTLDPSIALVDNVAGREFDPAEIREVRRFLGQREEEIRAAWPAFYAYVESFRAKWLAVLGQKRQGRGDVIRLST
ncbi:MAG TPA: hypothetical protein VMR21_06010 [Vicinamibacteria bacterium]|nr:hypothetical protein [Vicinamibacteria bacterium]